VPLATEVLWNNKYFSAHPQDSSKERGMVMCVLSNGLLLNLVWQRRNQQ
jgi:hypothetical protein